MAEPTPISTDAADTIPWWSLPSGFWRDFVVLILCVVPLLLVWVGNALNGLEGPLPSGEFPEVQVRFHAQQAVLTGRVLDEAQFQAAAKEAAEGYRSWGMNPVTGVRNDIVVRPNPPGFLVLIRERGRSMLAGQTSSSQEQGRLLDAVEPLLPARPDTLLLHTATERGPSGDLLITIESIKKLLSTKPADQPLLLAATLGKPAQLFEHSTETTAAETTFQEQGWDWEHSQSMLTQLRKWVAESVESDRRMALPLPHLTLLAAGNQVFLRGEVSTSLLRDRLLTAAKLFYGADRLRAEVVLTEARRPVAEAGPTLTSFPAIPEPTASGVLAFAVPGNAWAARELPESGFSLETVPTLDLVPAAFPLNLAQADFEELAKVQAQHQAFLAEMALKATYPVPFVAILLISKQIYVHGEVPTEELQQQVLAAAKQAYPDREVQDHLRLNDKRRPLTPEHAAQFASGMPPPPLETSPGIMAFIMPGLPWATVDIPIVELRAEEFDEFVHQKLIHSTFPHDDAKQDFDTFRNTVAEHFKTASRMKLSQAPPEPYLALLALGKQVFLRGNAGSETMKEAVLTAARKAYFDREIVDEIRVDSKPPIKLPPTVTNLTVKSFPPRPTFDGPGVLGFVRPPQPWLQVPLTVDHPAITLDWLVSQGLFSKDFDARQAWPDYESWVPKLPPGKKTPPPSAPPK